MDYQPVIIIGAARSGTNMLRDILNQLPNYGTWDCDEINPIWKHGNLDHPNDEFYAHMATPSVKKFIRSKFSKIAKDLDIKYVVEKSCANSLRVDFINEIFPEAKFIFIYRDGRDTVASAAIRWNAEFDLNYTLKKLRYVPLTDLPYYAYTFGLNRVKQLLAKEKQLSFWGVQIKNIQEYLKKYSIFEVCALQWKDCVEKSLKDFSNIEPQRVHRLSYEEFVSNPQGELTKITNFLGSELSDNNLPPLLKKVSSKSLGKYKSQLKPEEIKAVEDLIGPTLSTLNYNT